VAHAAGESAKGVLPEGTVVVVLAVPDQAQLLEIRRQLALAQLEHTLVLENAGPYAGQAMAIGLRPSRDRGAIGKVVSRLPLLK
jgi:hypothetical protein